ncbi:MAG: hypothetical protein N3D17_05825 [bacterium]|nr:hypothetical protein [bacterium]
MEETGGGGEYFKGITLTLPLSPLRERENKKSSPYEGGGKIGGGYVYISFSLRGEKVKDEGEKISKGFTLPLKGGEN